MKKFALNDLRNGDVIEYKNGSANIVCKDTGTLIACDGYNRLNELEFESKEYPSFSIQAIYRPQASYQCAFDPTLYRKGEKLYDCHDNDEAKKQKWVDDMMRQFWNNNDADVIVCRKTVDDAPVIFCFDMTNFSHVTMSHCAPDDIYDEKVGIAVAYAKYIGEKIPDFI